jgi:hypothetical protein
MPIATAEPEVKAPTKKEIEALKEEIRELYPKYLTRRLELGLKLLKLQEMLAHPGNGTFITTAVDDLGIPRSTVYELVDFAKAEVARVLKEKQSENRKDSDDSSMDWEDIYKLVLADWKGNKPVRKPKPQNKGTQLHFIFDDDTRREVLSAWAVLKKKASKKFLKTLAYKIAKEVINAAAKAQKKSK